MTDRIFIDSNVWVYLFTKDDEQKNKIAAEYIKTNAKSNLLIISSQVINEVCHVLKRKNFTEPEIRYVANDMAGICDVCSWSLETAMLASELRETCSLSFWDSQIIASALCAQCNILVSEDMHSGQKVKSLIVKNIFDYNEKTRKRTLYIQQG